MLSIVDTLENHKNTLLAIPGCTAVAIGKKTVGGVRTDIDCIVIYVRQKRTVPQHLTIQSSLNGFATDVVQKSPIPVIMMPPQPDAVQEPMATDPFARHDPLLSGISIATWEVPNTYGTIGCFVYVQGNTHVPAGQYMLTNEHVLQYVHSTNDLRVIQPAHLPPKHFPANYLMGNYVWGQMLANCDCCLTSVVGRNFENIVPSRPWMPGRQRLAGIAAAATNDRVYKYGATTGYTFGTVMDTHFSTVGPPAINNAIRVEGENGGLWADGGDSGSVLVRYSDNYVVGLNFRVDTTTQLPTGGFGEGFAYDLTGQLNIFGGGVLA